MPLLLLLWKENSLKLVQEGEFQDCTLFSLSNCYHSASLQLPLKMNDRVPDLYSYLFNLQSRQFIIIK